LGKASEASAALHFTGADRSGHGTSHALHNGRPFTFTEANQTPMTVGI